LQKPAVPCSADLCQLTHSLDAQAALQRHDQGFAPVRPHEGLGESDFRFLEVLLHKGPMPVNVIGPKVDLDPGSVSVAVDRLYKKGFVSRVECSSDRRIRTVSLTEKGREVFAPLFRRHAALIKRAFQDVSSEELQQLESVLRRSASAPKALPNKRVMDKCGGMPILPVVGRLRRCESFTPLSCCAEVAILPQSQLGWHCTAADGTLKTART